MSYNPNASYAGNAQGGILTRTADLAVGAGVETTITWQAVAFDSTLPSVFNLGAHPTWLMQAPSAGRWFAFFGTGFSSTNAGGDQLYIEQWDSTLAVNRTRVLTTMMASVNVGGMVAGYFDMQSGDILLAKTFTYAATNLTRNAVNQIRAGVFKP